MKKKRLFLFAGYCPTDNQLDSGLIYYVQELSKYGDIILEMDNDCSDDILKGISSFTLHAQGRRHGEYDFGSYKRAYQWAQNKNILNDYEYVYLVNDSVYGPIFELDVYLTKMESFNTDAFGLVYNTKKKNPHIQSWFIGMNHNVFQSQWFQEFIKSVKRLPDKGTITALYEAGFTKRLDSNNMTYKCIYNISGRKIYNNIKSLYKNKLPFIKKNAFIRHNGSLGKELRYVLNHIQNDARTAIINSATQTYGADYLDWLLTNNFIKILTRKTKYALNKLSKGAI